MKSLINTESWSREVVIVDDPDDVVQQHLACMVGEPRSSVRRALMGGCWWALRRPECYGLSSGDLGCKWGLLQ